MEDCKEKIIERLKKLCDEWKKKGGYNWYYANDEQRAFLDRAEEIEEIIEEIEK